MIKHLFFVFICLLAMCIPVTVHAEEMPASDEFYFYNDIVVTVKAGDMEFDYINQKASFPKITVTYGETMVKDIIEQFTLQGKELDPEKYKRVGPAVDGEDDEEGWYFWRNSASGLWRDRTTTKPSDVIISKLIKSKGTGKGLGAMYEYLGKESIKVVDEEGVELSELELAKGLGALYTLGYSCYTLECFNNEQWGKDEYYDLDDLMHDVFNPYDDAVNLDKYRIKVSSHMLYEGTCLCSKCNKYVITDVSDLKELWESFHSNCFDSDKISIESDIDFSDVTPTYALLPFFQYVGVTIDGHGHKISNFKGSFPIADIFCPDYENQTIKSLTIENFDITLTISDETCKTKKDENGDVHVLIMGDNNKINNCNFTGTVRIIGEEDKNYIPCLGYGSLMVENSSIDLTTYINGNKVISTGIADVEVAGGVYVSGRKIIATEDVRIYNLMGTDVTALNGMLSKGVYIVKGSKTTKVVVR